MSQKEEKNILKTIVAVGAPIAAALGIALLMKGTRTAKQTKPVTFDQSLKNASLEQLYAAREKYRINNVSDSNWEKILRLFDDEIRARKEANNPNLSNYSLPHREHGWYLPNDD